MRYTQVRSQIVVDDFEEVNELRSWNDYDGIQVLIMLETIDIETAIPLARAEERAWIILSWSHISLSRKEPSKVSSS